MTKKQPSSKRSTRSSSTINAQSEVNLTLHTKTAEWLCVGYGPEEASLLRFARDVLKIHQSAQADDPYADWALQVLSQHVETVYRQVQQLEAVCQQRVAQLRGLRIRLIERPNPFELPLRFSSPFAYQVAHILGELDHVLRHVRVLSQMGQLPNHVTSVRSLVRHIVTLLQRPSRWQATGVTRADIRVHNDRAKKAESIWGLCPENLLEKRKS